MTKRLVLNYGVRWEPWFPAYNRDNRGQTFSQGNSIVTRKLDNVSPRFGFAFDPTGMGKQSIRGSYTLLFDEPDTDQALEYTNSGVPYGGAVSVAFNNAGFT